jgi:hemoglobin-like flavoprotein
MDLHESLHCILGHKDNLADRFYQVFFERYPEVRPYFDGIDIRHQAEVLRMALMIMECHHTHAYPATGNYLKYLGTRHHERGVPLALFSKFRDALLASLKEFHGPDWDEELAGQWCGAYDQATQAMAEGYRKHFSV